MLKRLKNIIIFLKFIKPITFDGETLNITEPLRLYEEIVNKKPEQILNNSFTSHDINCQTETVQYQSA